MQVNSEDITVAWGQQPHPLDSQYGKWRLAVFQDVQESIDATKLYFLYDPIADEQSGTSGQRKGYPGLVIFDLNLRCFVGEISLHNPGKMKFLFALKCPSPQGGTSFVLVTEEEIYGQNRLNVFRVDLAQDGLSVANVRPLINQTLTIGGDYICSMREDAPEIVVMANPGLQIWRIDCMADSAQPPIANFNVSGADLNHFYDGFLNNGNIIFLSATPDGHFDNTRVHILNLNNPQHITSQNCSGDPSRGMPIPRKQCGFDSITNAILMAGGEVDRGYGGVERLVDYWVLDTRTFQWMQVPAQMSCPLIEPRLTSANSGNIYVWGDFDQPLPGMPPNGTHLRVLRVSGLEKANLPGYTPYAAPAPPAYPNIDESQSNPPYPPQNPSRPGYPTHSQQDMVELILELHDHEGLFNNAFHSKFGSESTLDDVKQRIHYVYKIPYEFQSLYVEGKKLGGLGNSSLQYLGLKHGSTVVVNHTLLPQWENYLAIIEEFREISGNRVKKEKAFEANELAKKLNEANFFSAYAKFYSQWLHIRKEYATFLDNIPMYIKEASKSFFIRKFGQKMIDVEFKDKLSGTRSGTMCIVSYDDTRRVYYVKTNHNASSISSSHRGPLHMIELFIYKLLEILGLGAVVQFIPNVVASDKIIYICGEEIVAFKTLLMLEKNWDMFERNIVKKREKIAREIIQLSLLVQILGLGDLNPENVGLNESSLSLYVVDFRTAFIDTSVAFEAINRPKTALSLVAQLKMNLGRFFDLVKEITFEEQLEIGKECIVEWELSSKLDEAFEQLEEEKMVFNRADLVFAKGTETLIEYISVVREKISQITAL